MDMRNGKKTCVRKMTSREILLGLIIPFILFWGGILTPVVTDSLLVWIFCLVPFYGFVVIFNNIFKDVVREDTFTNSVLLCGLTSFFLTTMLFAFPIENEVYRNVCRLGFFNVIPSVMFWVLGNVDNAKFGFGIPIFFGGNGS